MITWRGTLPPHFRQVVVVLSEQLRLCWSCYGVLDCPRAAGKPALCEPPTISRGSVYRHFPYFCFNPAHVRPARRSGGVGSRLWASKFTSVSLFRMSQGDVFQTSARPASLTIMVRESLTEGDGAPVRTVAFNCESLNRLRVGCTRGLRLLVACGILAVMTLTAASSPGPSPPATLRSGMEGGKAALVRIELHVVAEIAHIDHTSGEVEISRGRSTVPLGASTGVLISADGIVATTWENLAVDEAAVAVHAANELFANVIGVPVVGNDGEPARRGSTPDRYWAPHLQHCYDQVSHCVLFRVPQYHVRTYTSEPGGVTAELLNAPSGPHNVALLRISGGGAAPTAALAAPDTMPGADTVLLGFTERPAPEAGPAAIPVTADVPAGRVTSPEDLAAPLNAGVSGGPVIDPATGQVLGLTGPRQPDGSATFVPATAIHAAMTDAGVEASPSKFDAVFRRGIDHLSAGNPGGSAESALEEALTYYDSALAKSHLDQARALRSGQASGDPATAAQDAGSDGSLPAPVLPILAGMILLAGIIGAIALRRHRAAAVAPAHHGTSPAGTTRPPPVHAPAASVTSPKDRTGTGGERPAQTAAARTDKDPPGRGRADADLTKAAGHQSPAPRQFPVPATPAPSAPDINPSANPGPDAETRAAGPLAPRAAGQTVAFCSQCGRPVLPGARFCTGCGHPVG